MLNSRAHYHRDISFHLIPEPLSPSSLPPPQWTSPKWHDPCTYVSSKKLAFCTRQFLLLYLALRSLIFNSKKNLNLTTLRFLLFQGGHKFVLCVKFVSLNSDWLFLVTIPTVWLWSLFRYCFTETIIIIRRW